MVIFRESSIRPWCKEKMVLYSIEYFHRVAMHRAKRTPW